MKKLIILALITSAAIPTTAAAQRFYAREHLTITTNPGGTPADPADGGEPEITYTKIPTRAYIPSVTIPLPSNKVSVATHLGGVQCVDAATGEPASDPSACDTLPNPPNVGYLSISGAASTTLKKVYFDSSELLSIAPTLTNVSTLCAGATSVGSETWSLTCNFADLTEPGPYYTVANGIEAQTRNANIIAERSAANELAVSTSGYRRCWDSSTKQLVANELCDDFYTPNPEIGLFQISATWSENLRTILIDPTEVGGLARLGEVNPGAVTNFCESSVLASRQATYPQIYETWKIRCDPEDIRDHWVKVPGGIRAAQATANNVGSQMSAQQLAIDTYTDWKCVETDTDTATDPLSCIYHNPVEVGGQSSTKTAYQVPNAVWNVTARTVTINTSSLTALPYLTTLNPSAVSNFCGSVIPAYNGSTVNYTVVCN